MNTGRAVPLYQTVIVYWWPALVAIEQVPLKAVSSLRSPCVQLVMLRSSARVPLCASVVHVQVKAFVPYPPSSQQLGMPPVAASMPGFCSRLVLIVVMVTALVVVLLPALSTARAATVWLPSATAAEFQLAL